MADGAGAGETRTVHPLALPARFSDPGEEVELRRGLYVDCETTGFSPEDDAVIELAMLPFTYTLDGRVVERVLAIARERPWACSRAEVAWIAEGFASQALHCLLCAYGVFARDRHRALADCEAGVWLLSQRLPVSGESILAAMRQRALTETVRLWAIRTALDGESAAGPTDRVAR